MQKNTLPVAAFFEPVERILRLAMMPDFKIQASALERIGVTHMRDCFARGNDIIDLLHQL